jgi:hypothetical protein
MFLTESSGPDPTPRSNNIPTQLPCARPVHRSAISRPPQGMHGTAMPPLVVAPTAIETTSEHAYQRINMRADNALNSERAQAINATPRLVLGMVS